MYLYQYSTGIEVFWIKVRFKQHSLSDLLKIYYRDRTADRNVPS